MLLFALLCYSGAAMAQNVTITGRVVDQTDTPIMMANVLEAGTTNGTATDMDGNYQISVPVGATLEFSFIGYTPEKRKIEAGMSVLDIVLQEDTQVLDAVVVTALGIKRQEKALSYNAQSVKSDELTRVKDANLINSCNYNK